MRIWEMFLGCVMVACVTPTVTTCETPAGAVLCPANSVCTPQGCALAAQLAACSGMPDGQDCTSSTSNGYCAAGVCLAVICGDGIRAHREACDDGNTQSGDGCAANCSSNETCGNGIIDAREECDDGNTEQTDGCHNSCQVPRCGDGVVDTQFTEACDDGNMVDGDGCAATCRSSELCGNAIIDTHVGEQCDDGNTIGGDGCQHHCQLPRCGDGMRDPAEVCDDGNTASGDGCAATCQSTEICGNGIRDLGEACDDGNTSSGDGCATNCLSAERCGNGILDAAAGERCDDGNNINGDGCAATCLSDETCGNQFVDAALDEQCDLGLPGLSADGCSSTCLVENSRWNSVSMESLDGRDAMLAYHADAGVLFATMTKILGGFDLTDAVLETWAYDGEGWWRVPTTLAPPPRTHAALAYDAPRKQLVLFGGLADAPRNDTWVFDGRNWRQLTPATMPSARYGHEMVFDERRGTIVLFGGAQPQPLADTWEFDGTTWTKLTPPTNATTRYSHAMAYDRHRGVIVMAGGRYATGLRRDTWEFSAGAWKQITTVTLPAARAGAAMAYDPTTRTTLLLGGWDGEHIAFDEAFDEAWRYDGTNWRRIFVDVFLGQHGHTATWMPTTSSIVVLGYEEGAQSQLSQPLILRDGAQVYQEMVPFADELAAQIVEDPLRNRLVRLGILPGIMPEGGAPVPATLQLHEYDGNSWIRRAPPPVGAPLVTAPMVYDQARHRIVWHLPGNRETWAYDGRAWLRIATNGPATQLACAAYDVARDEIIWFGGVLDLEQLNATDQTWEFDGTTWRQRTLARAPSIRRTAACAYDPRRTRTVLFGGITNADVFLTDTWSYDGNTWEVIPTSGPRATSGVALVTNWHTSELALLTATSDTWYFDGSKWRDARAPLIGFPGGQLAFRRTDRAALSLGNGAQRLDVATEYAATETCASSASDTDGDGRAGCGSLSLPADPDCWGYCTPLCPPWTTASSGTQTLAWPAACDLVHPTAPHCGDGSCNRALEDEARCPSDCP